VGIARHNSGLDYNESVFFECPKNPLGNAGKICGFGDGQRFSCVDQNPERIGLARSADSDFLEIVFRNLTSEPGGVLFFRRDSPITNRDGQDAANGGFERAAVVVRHPVGQIEHRRADHRPLIQQAGDLLHSGEVALLQQLYHRSWQDSSSHGDPHARADTDFLGHRFRHPVIQHFSSRLIRQHSRKHSATIPAISRRLKSRRWA